MRKRYITFLKNTNEEHECRHCKTKSTMATLWIEEAFSKNDGWGFSDGETQVLCLSCYIKSLEQNHKTTININKTEHFKFDPLHKTFNVSLDNLPKNFSFNKNGLNTLLLQSPTSNISEWVCHSDTNARMVFTPNEFSLDAFPKLNQYKLIINK